jgi:hypothetical protein
MVKKSRRARNRNPGPDVGNVVSQVVSDKPYEFKTKTSAAGTASKTAGYDAMKYFARDMKYSALVAGLVIVVLLILYFTMR